MIKIGVVACVQEGYDFLKLFLKHYQCQVIVNFKEDVAKKYSGSTDFTDIAKEHDVYIKKIDSINSDESVKFIKEKKIDLLIVVGWSEILKKEIIQVPNIGVIGFHSSLLPKYRGSAPVNWAIINGEKYTGNTMFWIDEGLDTGAIIDQKKIEIRWDDNVRTIYEKISKAGFELFHQNFNRIKNKEVTKKNTSENYPLNLRREPMDGLINWESSSNEIYNFIRALTKPYPGAFTYTKFGKLVLWDAEIIDSESNNKPGYVLDISEDSIQISTSEGSIRSSNFEYEDSRYNEIPINLLLKKNEKISNSKKIVCIAAHYDDEVLGIGGTLINHYLKGDEVYIIFVCESYSVRYNKDNSILEDVVRASFYLGAKKVEHLKFPDQKLDQIDLLEITQSLEELINEIKPDIVYTHFINDMNKDHEIISRATLTACRPYSKTKVSKVYMFETPSSTEWNFNPESNKAFKPNYFVDISNSISRKLRAMRCYKSEIVSNKENSRHPRNLKMLRQRAIYWGSISNQQFSEPLILVRKI